MKIRLVIEYTQVLDNVTKIKSDGQWDLVDFVSNDRLCAIPREWIKEIEILNDDHQSKK